jgi:hypothetical protein
MTQSLEVQTEKLRLLILGHLRQDSNLDAPVLKLFEGCPLGISAKLHSTYHRCAH